MLRKSLEKINQEFHYELQPGLFGIGILKLDGQKKPAPKSLRQSSGKKAGGQDGHQGSDLSKFAAVTEPLYYTILKTGTTYDPQKLLKDIKRPVEAQAPMAA